MMENIELKKEDLGKPHYLDFKYKSKNTAIFFTKLSKQIEGFSDHHTYKVGAIAYGIDTNKRTFFVPTVNTIPDPIKDHFTTDDEIGDGHPSVHAEMMAMLTLPQFNNVSYALSKSPCPTCFEGMAELRNFKPENGVIDTVYFDQDSLTQQGQAQDKWDIAKPMLQQIGKKGKIGLCSIKLDEENISSITHKKIYKKSAHIENPITILEIDDIKHIDEADLPQLMGLATSIAKTSKIENNKEAALAIGKTPKGKCVVICASASLPPGFQHATNANLLDFDKANGKPAYNYRMSAAKRVMMAAVKEGIALKDGALICTEVPISGMLINATTYGLERIILPESLQLDDKNNMNHKALQQLTKAAIITVETSPEQSIFLGQQHIPDRQP